MASLSKALPIQIRSAIELKIPEGMITAEHSADAHFYRHNPSGILLPSVTAITGMMPSPHLKKWAAGLAADYLIARSSFLEAVQTNNDSDALKNLRAGAIMAHEDIFHDAGDVGTQGHTIIEEYLNRWIDTGERPEDITSSIEPDRDARLWAITRSAEAFCNDFRIIPIRSELLVANPKDGYAGTLDFLAYVAFPTGRGEVPFCEHSEIVSGSVNWHDIECGVCHSTWTYKLTLVDWKSSNAIAMKSEYVMQTVAYAKAFKVLTGIHIPEILIVRLDKKQMKYEVLQVAERTNAYKAFVALGKARLYANTDFNEKALSFPGREKVNITSEVSAL